MATDRCPLCNSNETVVRINGSTTWATSAEQAFLCTTASRIRPQVLECCRCRHQFSNPAHWPDDLAAEYEELEDHEYISLLHVKKRTFSRAADVVSRFAPAPATILEIGSYAGIFLKECRDRGYSVTGIEPSRWGVRHSREEGLDVHLGTAEGALVDGALGRFDVVVSWDVLEHVRDPIRFIRQAANHVRPGGYLIVSTLDRTNWFARLMGSRWPWIIPMHLHYFDKESVVAMAEACDFAFVATQPHVHYTSAGYASRRLLRHGGHVGTSQRSRGLDRLVFPVAFGDVRTYVFQSLYLEKS